MQAATQNESDWFKIKILNHRLTSCARSIFFFPFRLVKVRHGIWSIKSFVFKLRQLKEGFLKSTRSPFSISSLAVEASLFSKPKELAVLEALKGRKDSGCCQPVVLLRCPAYLYLSKPGMREGRVLNYFLANSLFLNQTGNRLNQFLFGALEMDGKPVCHHIDQRKLIKTTKEKIKKLRLMLGMKYGQLRVYFSFFLSFFFFLFSFF